MAPHVGVEGGAVVVLGLLGDRPELAFGAGVVDGHVDAAETLHGLLDEAAHVTLVAHVGTQVLGTNAERAQFGSQRLAGFFAAAADHQSRAFGSKGQGGGTADAREGAGDQDDGLAHAGAPSGGARGCVVMERTLIAAACGH
jgi:hypothetical protein